MENAFLIIITLAAGFYLYRKIFKKTEKYDKIMCHSNFKLEWGI